LQDAGAVTVFVFLSHADEDSEIAREVAARLNSEDVTVYSSQGNANNLVLTPAGPECAIQQADAFLALLSPDFLTSTSCRRERELAFHLEQRSRDNGEDGSFIQVLKVRETPYHQAGALHSRPWYDLTGQAARDRVLDDLASKFEPSKGPQPGISATGPGYGGPSGNGGRPRPPSPSFRNRTQELEEIAADLDNPHGEHFWVVIAPPQLGKSWFLDQLAPRFDNRILWDVKFVDARELAPELLGDAAAILRMMFGLAPNDTSARPMPEAIASAITGNNRVHLCLLDSAELLASNTVQQLRNDLSEISQRIARATRGHAGNPRLAFVAASRRDDDWKGVQPAPRLQIRRLTEFKVSVIREALDAMDSPFSNAQRQRLAERVHRLSEGLPALLAGSLAWIREQDWDVDRLEDHATFDRIARPYIENDLLSSSSLRGRDSVLTNEEQAAIRQALLVTSRYRFLTTTHLSHHARHGDLPDSTDTLGWEAERLWRALSATDLLYLPEREPWHEIYAPIRRLLFRHSYPEAARRAAAHRDARAFMQSFTRGLTGTDQCHAQVECLWHEAQALLLADAVGLEDALLSFARKMDEYLNPIPAFSKLDLRDKVARKITDDEEFAVSLAHIRGLFDRLVEVVRQPLQERTP
jgi:hypothetical protein